MSSLEDQIKAVERELALRKNVYPRMTARGSLSPERAAKQLADMQAVLDTLRTLKNGKS